MVHSTYRILPRAYLRRIYLYIIHIVKTCPVLSSSLKLEPLNYLFLLSALHKHMRICVEKGWNYLCRFVLVCFTL